MGLDISKFETIVEAKGFPCDTKGQKKAGLDAEFVVYKKQINDLSDKKKKATTIEEKKRLNDQYIVVLTKMIQSVMKKKEYMVEFVEYLTNMKKNCPDKYKKYIDVVIDLYASTKKTAASKMEKTDPNYALNVEFNKMCKIILDKTKVPSNVIEAKTKMYDDQMKKMSGAATMRKKKTK